MAIGKKTAQNSDEKAQDNSVDAIEPENADFESMPPEHEVAEVSAGLSSEHDDDGLKWKAVEEGKIKNIFKKISSLAALIAALCSGWLNKLLQAITRKKPFYTNPWFWGAAAFGLSLLILIPAMLLSALQKNAYLDLAISASTDDNFIETGEIYITGFDRLTAEDLQKAVSITPKVDFIADISENDPAIAVLSLKNVRNIAYTLRFRMTVKVPPPEEPTDMEAPFTEDISYTTILNGPQMTVVLQNSSIGVNEPIRLHFSEQVDIDSLEKNLKVSPYAQYTIEYNNFDVSLHPVEGWNPSGTYTVSVNADYISKSGKQLAANKVMSFRVGSSYTDYTPAPPSPSVEFVSDRSYILGESRDMTFIFQGSNLRNDVPVLIETYQMPSLEKYREQGHVYLNYDVPLDHLEKVDSNVYLISNGDNRFTLPHLGEGSYIIAAKYKHPKNGQQIEERASYLITSYSVYMQSSARDTLVWLNKSGEGAAAGYSFYFGGSDEPAGTTSADGTLLVDLAGNDSSDFSICDPAGNLVYYDKGTTQYGEQEERYYSYLFTDRTLYKPEDTVCLWGFAQPFRNNKMEMPDTVTVTFDPGGLDIVQELPVGPDGVFSGEIELERIKSSQYLLTVDFHFPSAEEGGHGTSYTLDSMYVSVKEYTKPSYILSSVVHGDFYGPKDEVTVTATASFYDGTPLPHFPVELSYYRNYGWVPIGTRTTDEHGNITFTFPAWEGGEREYEMCVSNQYKVQIASDGENVTNVGSYTVFSSDVLAEAEIVRQPDGANLALTIRTYELDLNSQALKDAMANQASDYFRNYHFDNARLLQIAKGKPVDVEDLNVSLRWDFFDTRLIRHRYYYNYYGYQTSTTFANSYSLDYITENNENVRVIQDPRTDEKLVQVSTQNGVATVSDLIYLGENSVIDFTRDAYCYANIRIKNGAGSSPGVYAYYPSYNGYREDWDEGEEREPIIVPGYSFGVMNLSTGIDITPQNDYGYRAMSMNVGDTARFNLMLDSMPVPTDGKILYSIIQDGIMESDIVDGSSFEFTYKMEHGVSLNLVAVYFDGMGTRAVKQIEISANTSSMMLNIDVTPDKTSYRPGDRANLNVKVTDHRGRGVSGNLCVAVVDESIFALSEQYIDVFSDLYNRIRYLNNSVVQYFTTYRDEIPENNPRDGGKGGGDSVEFYDSYRSNFKDTALFFPTTTDASGNAHISFDLPDNTTSWRITAVQVGHDLSAGQAKSNIISTLPFFCKPVLTPKYIEGDDFAMLVQGHGTLLDSDSEISYTVTVTGDNFVSSQTATGKAYEPQEINFGKLPIGSYKVVARAQYSGYSDTVELPISVIKSNLELVVNKPLDLSKPLDIGAMRYPVTITFYNKDIQPFVTSINSLFGHYCMQTSQRLSRVIAKQAIRNSMPGQEVPSYIADTSERISDMQNWDGGIGPHLDSISDPLLTTYVLLVAKDQFILPRMAGYYHDQLDSLDDPKLIAACHLGLAIIGEIDAETILEYIEKAERLDVKAYYIAALASIGETKTAAELYEKHCAPHVAKKSSGSLDWERDAAACWIAASILRHPNADDLSLYFGSYSWRFRTLYECMIYVSYYDRIVQPTSFNYAVKGQTHAVNLGIASSFWGGYRNTSGMMHTVLLSKSDLESFRLLNYSDNLSATAYYIGEPSEIGIQPSDNMRINKTVMPVDDNTYEVTLTIDLTKDAPTGQYDISDWIPSNSRFYSYDKEFSSETDDYTSFSVRQENQNLYVSFDNYFQLEKTILFKYRVRLTYGSEAALDTVYMIHGDSGENCNSVKGTFKP